MGKRSPDANNLPSPKKAKYSTKTVHAKAPAKVILFGEHAVVYPGKRALACALAVSTTTTVTDAADANTLDIRLPEVGIVEPLVIDLEALQKCQQHNSLHTKAHELSKDADLIRKLDNLLHHGIPKLARRAVLSLLVLYLGIFQGTLPISISASSEIPTGSGLGSSASFCVSLAASLLLYAGKIKPFAEGFGNSDDLNQVNEWALCGETVLHGLVSGVDNTVVCYGMEIGFVELFPKKRFPSLRMLLTNTKVEKDTKKQVSIVTSRMQNLKSVTEKLVDAVDAIVGECCTVFKDYDEGKNDAPSVCERVSTLIEMNHGILTSLGVSHPTLETVVNITKKYGLSSKLTGAGGGGCALTLIPDDNVRIELEKKGFECFESRVGCGGVSCWV
ncbi:mevalonate kinase-like protein [Obelidium mucronatum]|nr:mevalonate kinase-like protein [Obelidium mucronatum]